MVRKNYKETSASCLNCEVLDICLLKNDILSEEIEVADFAKEGCVKYKGEGEQRLFLPTEEVLRSIVKKPIYKSELRENFALNEKRLKLTFQELGVVVKEHKDRWTLVRARNKANHRNHEGVPIIMCDKHGEKLKRFPRIKDAVEYLKLDKGTSIQQSLRQGCMAYGYLWVRESEYGNR